MRRWIAVLVAFASCAAVLNACGSPAPPPVSFPNPEPCRKSPPPPASIQIRTADAQATAKRLPLHTDGRYIEDTKGRFKLASVNWYGAESPDSVPGGLQDKSPAEIADEIVKLGFNSVRLPWSNYLLECNPTVTNKAVVTANPSFAGQPALTVLDAVVQALVDRGLVVILDNHTSDPEWCCDASGPDRLWFNDRYSTPQWVDDWTAMVGRYKNVPAVVGADLRNEPGNGASWGGGGSNDWHAAAQQAGQAVLGANRNLLVFVEGINSGGDLSGVTHDPIDLNDDQHLVYSAHDYANFQDASDRAGVAQTLHDKWGQLTEGPHGRPVWIGEFGTCNGSSACVGAAGSSGSRNCLRAGQGEWFASLAQYLAEGDFDWAYWPLNGTQSTPEAGGNRAFGQTECYGLLDPGWSAPASSPLICVLQALQAPSGGSTSAVESCISETTRSGGPQTTAAADPCPATNASPTAGALPVGWGPLGATAVTAGGDPGGFCIHSDALYWGGITRSQVPGTDYSVEAQGRLAGGPGWGLGARVTVAADGSVVGHAIQYDPGAGGDRDVDYPDDTGPTMPAPTDSNWHDLTISVHGDQYQLNVDGHASGEGTLAQATEMAGGAFVRVWNGATVELRSLNVRSG